MKYVFQKLTAMVLISAVLVWAVDTYYGQQNSRNSISLEQAVESGIGYDTLDYTVKDYVEYSRGTLNTTARASTVPEDLEGSAERTCAAFLSLGAAASRSDNYSISPLIASDAAESREIVYFESVCDYLNRMHSALGWKVYQDNMQFSDFQTVLLGNTAEVSVVEEYTYYMSTGDTEEDSDQYFQRRQYFFALEREPDGWAVTKVTSDHYEEQMDGFDYTPIAVEQKVQEILERKDHTGAEEIPDEKITEEDLRAVSIDLYKWTYDTSAAVDYAETYYNTFSELFGDVCANCQDFAS